MYRRIMTALVLALLASCAAAAQGQANVSPEKRALIKEIIALTNLQDTMNALTKGMADQLARQGSERIAKKINELPDLTPQEREKLLREMTQDSERNVRITKRYAELAREQINWPELMEDVIVYVFDKYYTDEELKAIADFYKSPAGRKMMQTMPQATSDIMVKSEAVIGPKLDAIFQQVMLEERKRPPQ
jgi:hypothetical protein